MKGPWEGDRTISAEWRYSSGAGHFSWDVVMPIGTPLYAIGNGTIVDCNDGVKDQPPGRPAGSGAPSNWIILKFEAPDGPYKGKTLHAYYQHLTKGLKVKKGQKVKKGEVIGKSGNSGNTTGPHLHLTILKPGHSMNAGNRYAYLNNPNMVVWKPKKAWGDVTYGPIDIYLKKLKPGVDGSKSVRYLRKCLINRGLLVPKKGLSVKKPGNKYTVSVERAVELWQKRHGHKKTGKLTYAQAEEFFAWNTRVKLHK